MSVGLITLVLLAIWLANLGNAWKARQMLVRPFDQSGFSGIKAEIGDAVGQIESSTAEVKLEPVAASSSQAVEIIKEVEDYVADKKNASSSRICPEYIDCMPTIGPAKPCQVPPGCEGITQIAY